MRKSVTPLFMGNDELGTDTVGGGSGETTTEAWKLLSPPWVTATENDNHPISTPVSDGSTLTVSEARRLLCEKRGPLTFASRAVDECTTEYVTNGASDVYLYVISNQSVYKQEMDMAHVEAMRIFCHTIAESVEYPNPMFGDLFGKNTPLTTDEISNRLRDIGLLNTVDRISGMNVNIQDTIAHVRVNIPPRRNSDRAQQGNNNVADGEIRPGASESIFQALESLSRDRNTVDLLDEIRDLMVQNRETRIQIYNKCVPVSIRASIAETEDLIWSACGGDNHNLPIEMWLSPTRQRLNPKHLKRTNADSDGFPDVDAPTFFDELLNVKEMKSDKLESVKENFVANSPSKKYLISKLEASVVSEGLSLHERWFAGEVSPILSIPGQVANIRLRNNHTLPPQTRKILDGQLARLLIRGHAKYAKKPTISRGMNTRQSTLAALLYHGNFNGLRVIEHTAQQLHMKKIDLGGHFTSIWTLIIKDALDDLWKLRIQDDERSELEYWTNIALEIGSKESADTYDDAVLQITCALQMQAWNNLKNLSTSNPAIYDWLYNFDDATDVFGNTDVSTFNFGKDSFVLFPNFKGDNEADCKIKNEAVNICIKNLWEESVRAVVQGRRIALRSVRKRLQAASSKREHAFVDMSGFNSHFTELLELVHERKAEFKNIMSVSRSSRDRQRAHRIEELLHWFKTQNGTAPVIDSYYRL